eukprot:2563034-Prymnesium_polylepis.1
MSPRRAGCTLAPPGRRDRPTASARHETTRTKPWSHRASRWERLLRVRYPPDASTSTTSRWSASCPAT